MFVMGPFWQEHRRFTMRHLRNLGFGKTSIEDQMMGELRDLIKDMEISSRSDTEHVVDLKGIFQVSVLNILWAMIAGSMSIYENSKITDNNLLHFLKGHRFERDDPKFHQLLTANEQFFRAGDPVRGSIPIPALILKHSRIVREFIGLKRELIEPIQKFIQVF